MGLRCSLGRMQGDPFPVFSLLAERGQRPSHIVVLTTPCPAWWTALSVFTSVLLFAMEFLEQKKCFLYLGNDTGKHTP